MQDNPIDVLVTTAFSDAAQEPLHGVSPRIVLTQATPERADYSRAEILYAGSPPHDLTRAPKLRWVQVHMAGVDALRNHPLYADESIALTTTSGVHASTVAEYAVTV